MMRDVQVLLPLLPLTLAAALGCGRSGDAVGDEPIPVARERLSTPRAQHRIAVRPLAPAPDAPPLPAPAPSGVAAAAANLPIDARVLIITADGTDAALDAMD